MSAGLTHAYISLGENRVQLTNHIQLTNHKENYMDIIKDGKEFNKRNNENIKAKKAIAEKFLLEIARIAGVDAKSFELKGRAYNYEVMLAGVPLCVCAVNFTDGDFKFYDGMGLCTKWTVKSDNECNIHCEFFSAFEAMMGEDGTLKFESEGDLAKFESSVKATVAKQSSRVLYESDGIIAIANKEARYGVVYVGKKEYHFEFFHDTKDSLCFNMKNTKVLACHFGVVSKLMVNKIIPAMEEE